MRHNELFRKLCVNHRFFTIAIKKKESDNFLENGVFVPDIVLPASNENWQADPMLVEDGKSTFMFYEKVIGDKGHIEVVEIDDDCTISSPQIVLESDCHYSYPFVFKQNGNWYMIPESSQIDEVALYEAEIFPYKWTKRTILLNKKAVDTTWFLYKNKPYLLTFYLTGNTERVIPHIFEFVWSDGELQEIPWPEFDGLKVRGAGPVFVHDNHYIRPAQMSDEQRYGDGLVFYEIHIDDDYNEVKIKELLSDSIQYRDKNFYVDGLHTYSSSSKYEVIDIRGGVIDYLKPIKKLFSKLVKR